MRPSVLSYLEDVVDVESGWSARCPSHKDRVRSLSVRHVNDKTLVKCHKGCTVEEILEAIGQPKQILFDRQIKSEAKKRFVCSYDYKDASGKLVFQKVRWEPKTFSQRRPDGANGWIYDLHGVEPILYRLPDLVRSTGPVYLMEGEKAVDRAWGDGLVATCSPGGAGGGKWSCLNYVFPLKGRDVVLVPDNDDVGREHMSAAAYSLLGVARSIRTITLPVPEKCDYYDMPKGSAAAVSALARDAPLFVPEMSRFFFSAIGSIARAKMMAKPPANLDEVIGMLQRAASSLNDESQDQILSMLIGRLHLYMARKQ
jgi:hypothetical protein